MRLILKREQFTDSYTIGKLYIDNVYFCDVIEDCDRGLDPSMPIEEIMHKKIAGQTAIPKGEYKITLDIVSSKFKDRTWAKFCNGKLPRLLNVPGYEGVLIHVGNTAEDSLGCLLVGQNTSPGKVSNSTVIFKSLYEKLAKDKDNLTILIQ